MALQRLEFFIPSNRVAKNGRKSGMDGENDLVRSARGNRFAAAKRKADNEIWVSRFASEAAEDAGWSREDVLHTVELTFIEPDMRRDDDNVFGAAKFILDALCEPQPSGKFVIHRNGAGVIPDDDPFHVCLICRRGPVDRDAPGVKVRVTREV